MMVMMIKKKGMSTFGVFFFCLVDAAGHHSDDADRDVHDHQEKEEEGRSSIEIHQEVLMES